MLRFVILLACLLAGPATADRPPVPGEDVAEFVEARDAWLDGDDLTALTSLKGLAQGGNTAAQILLARIGEEPHMHRHLTADMKRAERIALLRQPGGVSGKSWLRAAVVESDLASALVLRNVAFNAVDGVSPEAVAAARVLLDYGEVELATEIAFKLIDEVFLNETLNFLDTYAGDLSPVADKLRASVLLTLAPSQEDAYEMRAQAEGILDAMPPEKRLALAELYPWQVEDNPELQTLLIRYAELVPDWAPMRDICETSCAPSYDTCLLAGATSLGYARRFPFLSPLTTLVPNGEYWSSARMPGDAARRMAEIAPAFEAAGRFDTCFAETIASMTE